jgi:signal transduction histidine kinase
MPDKVNDLTITESLNRRTAELFHEHQQAICRRTDRIFMYLLPLQWAAAVAIAVWISPLTWSGTTRQLHPHLLAALLLGGAVTALPFALAFTRCGAAITRYSIAVGQMLMSALLIHLTGGRIETHFHVFGSLAFLAFYRDWKVFVPATVVVAADHLLRGLFWPESVFGTPTASSWRWLEHAGWVVFEDVFLLISCRQSIREMHDIAEQRAVLENTQRRIEAEVVARTADLREAQKQNLVIARRAGMADIATSVLHNVGNVLNSVTVSASVISDRVHKSGTAQLRKATELLEAHLENPGTFVTEDARGKHLPKFLVELGRKMTADESGILDEIATLSKSIGHITQIVSLQQSYAGVSGFVELVSLPELLDDAIRINEASVHRHEIDVVRQFDELPAVALDKQKFLQIVVNLVSNAKYALIEKPESRRTITLRLTSAAGRVRVEVADNGVGIPAENLTRIFSHGFTTRKDGHGFGLHSAANLAGEMGGTLTACSAGPRMGATFTLDLPLNTTPPDKTSAEASFSGSSACPTR